jgi:hypothetical protein
LNDDIRTAVVELGRDILIRVDGIITLNGDVVGWTASRSGMNSRNERLIDDRRGRTRVPR